MGMKIGTTIRSYRLQKGLSQGDIEKKTGLLRCYLSRVENGHTVPSLDTLAKIANSLDLPIAQFFASDTLARQLNAPESYRRRAALPDADPALLLKPERQRPQAAAGHGEEVRGHGSAIKQGLGLNLFGSESNIVQTTILRLGHERTSSPASGQPCGGGMWAT